MGRKLDHSHVNFNDEHTEYFVSNSANAIAFENPNKDLEKEKKEIQEFEKDCKREHDLTKIIEKYREHDNRFEFVSAANVFQRPKVWLNDPVDNILNDFAEEITDLYPELNRDNIIGVCLCMFRRYML